MIAVHPSCTAQRPAYVDQQAEPFVGRCRIFPKRNVLLLHFQGEWVRDRNIRKLAEKSRQIGWTWASAYNLVRKLGRKRARDNQWDAWITSRDADQARLFVVDVMAFAGLLQVGAEDLGERLLDEERGSTTDQVRFANGLIAHSMSSNFNAQAGKRGHRTLDEFGLHEHQRELFAIASPGVTWGGTFEIFSTHRGSHTFFNQLVQEARHKGNPKRFSLHRVTLENALEQGFLYKLQSKLPLDDPRQELDEGEYFDLVRQGCADEESFQQEYMCVPADDASAFLDYAMICAREYHPGEEWETDLVRCQNPLFVGVDVGRDHDLTVIWVLEQVGSVLFTRRVIEMQNERFAVQEHELYQIMELPRVRRACFDATGLGRQFAERAQERFGTFKVEEVKFTMPVKEELAYPLRARFEDGTVWIPSRPEIRSDLRAIRKETTAAGNLRFTADRGKNGHADRFWALALAIHAAGQPTAGSVGARPFSAADLGSHSTDVTGMF